MKRTDTSSELATTRSALTRRAFLCCCLTVLVGLSQSWALTIYRIGGENVPLPDPAALGAPPDSVRFVLLKWDDLDEQPFGSSQFVEIRPDSVRPQYMPPDLNLTPLVKDEGGVIKGWAGYNGFQQEDGMEVMWDGDLGTYYVGQAPFIGSQGAPYCGDEQTASTRNSHLEGHCKHIWVSLSGVFPLRSVRVIPPPGTEEDRHISAYTLGINDGDPFKIGTRPRSIWDKVFPGPGKGTLSVDFDVVTEVMDNRRGVLEFELSGEPVQNIVFIALQGNWWIGEFEVYADGFAVSSNYSTEVIDLGDPPATLGPLSWSGTLHPGSSVDLRVRSGDAADPNIYYRNTFRGDERSRYDAEGNPLDRRAYLRLELGEQGGIGPDLESWSSWSAPLEFGDQAAQFGTTRPRQYVQFKADFHSGGRLDYLEFPVTQPPAVTRAVAEIEPERVAARETTRFAYFLRPEISVGDAGFDRIRIAAPDSIDGVESVTVGADRLESSEWEATIDSTGFEVSLPRMGDRQTRELVAIVFHARVYDYGTVFEGRVYDSNRPWEVPQLLEPGDADLLAENNSLTVDLIDVGQGALDQIEISTAVFTPNGDGVNDRLDIRFDLLNLSAEAPVNLRVFDLSGTRRAELPQAQLRSGPHEVSWDGRDENERLLAPGIYLLQLEVETDDDTFTASRAVSLAY